MDILSLVNAVEPAYTLPFPTVFLVFIIFSFAGWCAEVLYVGIFFEHKFINRGFLHGPLCPIYGCGGLVLLFLPKFLYNTWFPLFFASMILCSAVEYFISWLLEKMFHTLWWDYSHYKVNLNGRICLLNSCLFGIMGVLAIHFVIPLVMMFLDWLGNQTIKISSTCIAVVLTVDMIVTVRRLVDFNVSLARLKSFGESLKDHYGQEEWFNGTSLHEMFASVKAQAESGKISSTILSKIEVHQGKHKNIESFMKRFPTLKSKVYKDEINLYSKHLKSRLEELKKRRTE